MEDQKSNSPRKGKVRTLNRFCMRFVIKRLMEKKKIETLREISLATGIPNATFNDWTTGRFTQNPEYLDTLAKYFDVSVEYLMFGEETDREKLAEENKRLEQELVKKEIEILNLKNQISLFDLVEKEKNDEVQIL